MEALVSTCHYCGSQFNAPASADSSLAFCCLACEGLYKLENRADQGLDAGSFERSLQKFQYLEEPLFQRKYLRGPKQMLFYAEGLHCSSCVHLLEKLPEFDNSIQESQVNFGESTLLVTLGTTGSWSRVAALISELGYIPTPLEIGETAQEKFKNENRQFMKRLAVAGACAGNMMLFVVPVYGGLEGPLKYIFHWLSFFLFLPILFYSAQPFYQGAWNFLKYRVVNVDLPITVAMLSGFFLSTFNLIRDEGPIYYDSTASFLFFILASRYLLKRVQQKYLSAASPLHLTSPDVEIGEVIEVQQGQKIPVDGELLSPAAEIDLSLFNGESLPQIFHQHMKVFAGTLLLSSRAKIRVERLGKDTRWGQLLQQLQQEDLRKNRFVSLTDRLAQNLILIVFSIAILFFALYVRVNFNEALERSLALIVVACPCALAFGTPLAYGLALRKARSLGILMKNSESLEKILQVKNLFFDKTGTLTEGTLSFVRTDRDLNEEDIKLILALESQSYHPVAFALRRAFPNVQDLPSLKNLEEILGSGVTNKEYSLRSSPHTNADGYLTVAFYKGQTLVNRLHFSDTLRPDSEKVLAQLRNYNVYLLSGDKSLHVKAIASQCGLPLERAHGELTPQQKAILIHKFPHSCMIGDGANDSLALQAADVGIAVKGSVDLSLSSADIYFTRGGLSPFLDLLNLAKQTRKTVGRNLAIALIYNFTAGVCALCGFINPMVAALLMPISSALIIVSSLRGRK